jgi:hypothetical protein
VSCAAAVHYQREVGCFAASFQLPLAQAVVVEAPKL